LELILFANTENAGLFHEVAKDLNRKTMPPLAKLHLDGESCNGLSDMFYIAAVTIKKLIDKQFSTSDVLTAHLTMLTLLSDSGFQTEAERHLKEALQLKPNDSSLKMRSILMTPGVYDSFDHLHETRDRLEKRLANISQDTTFAIKTLDELSLSPIFYFVYQGYNDAPFMHTLQELYSSAHPTLVSYKIDLRPAILLGTPVDRRSALDSSSDEAESVPKIRVGFVSSHFRRHSICKLFCHVISGLSNHTHTTSSGEKLGFEVYVFSGQDQSKEDGYTTQLKQNVKEFVRIKKFTTASRREVTNRFIDVLVYLDIGMDPSTSVWGASKLAPIQACLWGHPTTTGMGSMDYFISADGYHMGGPPRSIGSPSENTMESYENANWYQETERSFTEQLVRLPSAALGFAFNKPTLDLQNPDTTTSPSPEDLVTTPQGFLNSISLLMPNSTLPNATDPIHSLESLVQLKIQNGSSFVLIPQHLPKFHPGMDSLISRILSTIPNCFIVITYEMKRTLWRRTLEKRWLSNNISQEIINTRFLWLTQLSPQQYLGLLALGDVMLDPFPFGGGVTSLEAFSMCTPVLTLPNKQTVPALTAGMIRTMFTNHDEGLLKEFIFPDEDTLFHQIQSILTDPQKRFTLRQSICDNNHRLYSGSVVSTETIQEWGQFLYSVSMNNFF
jgi:protein O-GlcNAc transferase